MAAVPGGAEVCRNPRPADQAHGLVDDQLADVEGDDRQQRAHQPQAQAGEVSGLLVAQISRRNGGMLRSALTRSRRLGRLAGRRVAGMRECGDRARGRGEGAGLK
jgi:hypothetical protein